MTVLEICTPVAGAAIGTYTCTSESVGAPVITYIKVATEVVLTVDGSSEGWSESNWDAYETYASSNPKAGFNQVIGQALSRMSGRSLHADNAVFQQESSHVEHTLSDDGCDITLQEQRVFKLDVNSKALKDRLQKDVTSEVLRKVLSNLDWADMESISGISDVTTISFSDVTPTLTSGGSAGTFSVVTHETMNDAQEARLESGQTRCGTKPSLSAGSSLTIRHGPCFGNKYFLVAQLVCALMSLSVCSTGVLIV
jgi:hypothetical protein